LILVILGTHERPFYRLVKGIERLIQEKKIREKVIVQLGFTNYKVRGAKCYRFIPEKRFEEYVKKCSILITHGGLGSIMRGVKADKPVIAVPRRAIFGEHTDDHQLQIVEEAKKRGRVFVVYDIKELEKTIKKCKKIRIKSKKVSYTPKRILKIIDKKLKEWSNH